MMLLEKSARFICKNNDAWDKLKNDIWKFFLSCKKEKNKDKNKYINKTDKGHFI